MKSLADTLDRVVDTPLALSPKYSDRFQGSAFWPRAKQLRERGYTCSRIWDIFCEATRKDGLKMPGDYTKFRNAMKNRWFQAEKIRKEAEAKGGQS